MRILLISNIFPPGFVGGYELGALDVARALGARGHAVRVLTSDYFVDDTGELEDVDVVRTLDCAVPGRLSLPEAEQTRRGWLADVRDLRRVGSELIAFLPDVVIGYNLIGIGPVGLLQFLISVGMAPVLHLMDDVFYACRFAQGESAAARRVFGAIDFLADVEIIVMSRRLRADVERTLGRELPNVTLVPGWFDPALGPRPIAPSRSGEDGVVRFVFASRIAEHKGIGLALEAARSLVEAGAADFALDIYGAGETAWLAQQVAVCGLGKQVHYRGTLPKSEMSRRFGDYDALLFPTMEREPFGFVVAEAAAAGCIPIMTGAVGAAEWFFDGIDCLKIRRSAADLAAAMRRLLVMSQPERKEMHRQSSRAAHQFLNFSRALPIIEAVIERAAARSRPIVPAQVRACEAAMTLLDNMHRRADVA